MDFDIQRAGDSYFVTNGLGILEFAAIEDHRAGLSAEITATVQGTGDQHWSRLNLAAPRSRSELARALELACPGPHWGAFLDRACQDVVLALRKGDPPVELVAKPPSPERWMIPGLIPTGETSLIYGDGGTMKSLFALALAWSGLQSRPLANRPWWKVEPVTRVLYLDWESNETEHAARWWGFCQTAGIENVAGLIYLPMTRPLVESMPQLLRGVAREGVDLLIVDSLAPACGAEPEGTDAAVRTMTAIRSIPCTRLVVAHVSKATADGNGGGGPPRPFGSVFVRNLSRSTIYADLDDEGDGPARVTYHHTKLNGGKRRPPASLAWTFSEGGEIRLDHAERDPKTLPIPLRILGFLRFGPQTATSIAAELDLKENTVRSVLGRLLTATKVLRLEESDGGKGQKTLWGLVDANRNNS